MCGRGAGVDDGGDDEARAHTQRGQDLAEECPAGTLRFPCYSFGPHRYKANGKRYLGASPSKRSVQRLKTTVGNLLGPGNNEPWPEVRDKLNRVLLGWSN